MLSYLPDNGVNVNPTRCALEGNVLTTGPPGKALKSFFLKKIFFLNNFIANIVPDVFD